VWKIISKWVFILKKTPRFLLNVLMILWKPFLSLKERLNQHAGTLSGGERAMLAVARGLISDPDLLLMDEPSMGLSPLMVEETFKMVDRINQERKITILLVEQNANKALAASSRGYILQKGEIVFSGSREELMENKIVKECYLEV
jgi:branched-chain amino acid transport system ATP-binding protein